jgi:hypothetical protein
LTKKVSDLCQGWLQRTVAHDLYRRSVTCPGHERKHAREKESEKDVLLLFTYWNDELLRQDFPLLFARSHFDAIDSSREESFRVTRPCCKGLPDVQYIKALLFYAQMV